MLYYAGLNIVFEVKDMVRTIDFYNILLGETAADLYPKHAKYTIKRLLITLTFIENPATDQPTAGNFSLILNSDKEVYERFIQFSRNGFVGAIKIDHNTFSPDNHTFSVKDPNGIVWKLNIQNKELSSFKLFNIPRMNSIWDILRPL